MIFKICLPFLYGIFFIIIPVYGLRTDYGWTVVICFWIPAFIFYALDRRRNKASGGIK